MVPVRALEQISRRTAASARTSILNFALAGRSDWRLPRLDIAAKDATCANPTVLFGGGASAGCRLNELGHLSHGWGVSVNTPGPFVMPAGGGPVWFEDLVGDVAPLPVTYSFDGGVLRTDTAVGALGVVFPVRDLLPSEVPRGNNVIVEPIPDVVVRFDHVASGGAISASVTTISTFPLGQSRVFTLATSAAFDQATVCLRYPGELNGIIDVRVARKQSNGVLDIFLPLPLVPGYPDTLNHVVCGRTSSMGEFRVKDPSTFP